MQINEISVVRKVIKSQTYFITISRSLIPPDWKRLVITMAPLDVKWGTKKMTIVKDIGKSVLYNSIKLVLPKTVVEHLGLNISEYGWFRFMNDTGIQEEPSFPSIPYLADVRGIHGYLNTHFMLISKTYLNKLIEAMDNWSGKLYLAFKAPTGDVVRMIVKPKDYRNYKMYHIVIPHEEVEYLLEKTSLRGQKVYTVVAPLPEGYSEKILINPPPTFPL